MANSKEVNHHKVKIKWGNWEYGGLIGRKLR
jgi:hypothetical protein